VSLGDRIRDYNDPGRAVSLCPGQGAIKLIRTRDGDEDDLYPKSAPGVLDLLARLSGSDRGADEGEPRSRRDDSRGGTRHISGRTRLFRLERTQLSAPLISNVTHEVGRAFMRTGNALKVRIGGRSRVKALGCRSALHRLRAVASALSGAQHRE